MQELQTMPQTEIQQLEVLQVQPAIIEFNFEEMKSNLEKYIEIYNNLVITADGVQRAKKDLAELNKLKKTIDDFRIKTKKDASKNITAFEDKCKTLTGIIATAHTGIKEQVDTFEEQRRIERQKEVQNLIDKALEKSNLPAEYKAKITIKSEYLNISNTNAKINQDINYDISALELEYAQEVQKKELINSLCEVQNQKHSLQVPLDPVHYYRYDLDQAKEAIEQAGARAKEAIEQAGARAKQAQEDAIRRIEAQAKEKAEKEAQAKIAQEARKLAQEQIQEAEERAQKAQKEADEALELVGEMAQQVDSFIPVESNQVERERILLNMYVTESQKSALFSYLKQIGIEYEQYA